MPVCLDVSRQFVAAHDSARAWKKTNNLTNVKISIGNEENYYEFKPTSIWLYKQQMFRWWTQAINGKNNGEGSIQAGESSAQSEGSDKATSSSVREQGSS